MAKNLKEFAETLQDELTENINLRKEIETVYNYLQSIVDSSPDTLFDVSSNGIINYVSGDLARGAELYSEQIKGKHFTEFVLPEHKALIMAIWEDVRK